MFPCEFCEFSKNTFFYRIPEIPPMAASGSKNKTLNASHCKKTNQQSDIKAEYSTCYSI